MSRFESENLDAGGDGQTLVGVLECRGEELGVRIRCHHRGPRISKIEVCGRRLVVLDAVKELRNGTESSQRRLNGRSDKVDELC